MNSGNKKRPPRTGRPPAATRVPAFDDIVAHGVSRHHLAQLFGIAGTKVDSWRRRGCPTTGGKFVLRDVVAWLEQQREQAARGPGTGEDSEKALARWRTARATQAELQLAQERGELVSREDVVEQVAATITVLKARFRDATKKLAVRLFQGPSIVANEQELRSEFDSMLRAFASGVDIVESPPAGEQAAS